MVFEVADIIAAILNPFSVEAEELARTSPPLDSMPREIIDRAVARVGWKMGKEMLVAPEESALRAEALSFYLMCQGVAAISHPYSREARAASGATGETVRYRIHDLFRRGHEEACVGVLRQSIQIRKLGEGEIPPADYLKLKDLALAKVGLKEPLDSQTRAQFLPRYMVRWTSLSPLMRRGRLELANLYLIGGWTTITPRELWEIHGSLVEIQSEDYIASLCERFAELGEVPKTLAEVGERIASAIQAKAKPERFAPAPARLRPECFPPCVRKALEGVPSGIRNYAIVMLLTPFLSYARVSPSGKAASRMADFVSDISVVRDEIAPLIFEAAERCDPPLFIDQPQERASIFYHMGFGLTVEPSLKQSGRSRWYKTPNCEKVKISAPALCDPDSLCKEIRNPLTYYYRRRVGRIES